MQVIFSGVEGVEEDEGCEVGGDGFGDGYLSEGEYG